MQVEQRLETYRLRGEWELRGVERLIWVELGEKMRGERAGSEIAFEGCFSGEPTRFAVASMAEADITRCG